MTWAETKSPLLNRLSHPDALSGFQWERRNTHTSSVNHLKLSPVGSSVYERIFLPWIISGTTSGDNRSTCGAIACCYDYCVIAYYATMIVFLRIREIFQIMKSIPTPLLPPTILKEQRNTYKSVNSEGAGSLWGMRWQRWTMQGTFAGGQSPGRHLRAMLLWADYLMSLCTLFPHL